MKYCPGRTSEFRIVHLDGTPADWRAFYSDDPDMPVLELTRRNLQTLLDKLDDPDSARTLIDGEGLIAVRAVEDIEHYRDRAPGPVYTNGVES